MLQVNCHLSWCPHVIFFATALPPPTSTHPVKICNYTHTHTYTRTHTQLLSPLPTNTQQTGIVKPWLVVPNWTSHQKIQKLQPPQRFWFILSAAALYLQHSQQWRPKCWHMLWHIPVTAAAEISQWQQRLRHWSRDPQHPCNCILCQASVATEFWGGLGDAGPGREGGASSHIEAQKSGWLPTTMEGLWYLSITLHQGMWPDYLCSALLWSKKLSQVTATHINSIPYVGGLNTHCLGESIALFPRACAGSIRHSKWSWSLSTKPHLLPTLQSSVRTSSSANNCPLECGHPPFNLCRSVQHSEKCLNPCIFRPYTS